MKAIFFNRHMLICAAFLTAAAANAGTVSDFFKGKTNGPAAKAEPAPEPAALAPFSGPRKKLLLMRLESQPSAFATAAGDSAGVTQLMIQAAAAMAKSQGAGDAAPAFDEVKNLGFALPSENAEKVYALLTQALADTERFLQVESPANSEGPGAARLLGAQVVVRPILIESSEQTSSKRLDVRGALNRLNPIAGQVTGIVGSETTDGTTVLAVELYNPLNGQMIARRSFEGHSQARAATVTVLESELRFKGAAAEFLKTPAGKAALDATRLAVRFIAEHSDRIAWEGRVADLETDAAGKITQLYLNAGARSGLKVGDELIVVRPGRDIVDPISNQLIGRAKDRQVGECRIESAEPELASAAATAGDGFQKGDIVQIKMSGAMAATR